MAGRSFRRFFALSESDQDWIDEYLACVDRALIEHVHEGVSPEAGLLLDEVLAEVPPFVRPFRGAFIDAVNPVRVGVPAADRAVREAVVRATARDVGRLLRSSIRWTRLFNWASFIGAWAAFTLGVYVLTHWPAMGTGDADPVEVYWISVPISIIGLALAPLGPSCRRGALPVAWASVFLITIAFTSVLTSDDALAPVIGLWAILVVTAALMAIAAWPRSRRLEIRGLWQHRTELGRSRGRLGGSAVAREVDGLLLDLDAHQKGADRSASLWNVTRLVLGVLAAVTATAAGVLASQKHPSTGLVAFLSITGGAVTALVTALNPGKRYEEERLTAMQCEALRREVGVMSRVDLPAVIGEPLEREALEDVLTRFDAVLGLGDKTSFWRRTHGEMPTGPAPGPTRTPPLWVPDPSGSGQWSRRAQG